MIKRHKKAIFSKIATAMMAFGLAQSAMADSESIDGAPVDVGPDPIEQVEPASPIEQSSDSQNAVFTQRSLEFNPLIPIALIAGMGALYGAACLYQGRKGVKGAWLRAAAGGVVVVTLMNPEILEEEREKLPTEVAVVVDKSASQTLDGRADATQRAYDQVVRELSGISGVNIRTIEIDSQSGDSTDVFGALDTNLSDVPRDRLGGVIILSDGQVHDIPENTDALGIEAPIHALISGYDGERDRRIVLEATPRFGLVDETQNVRFKVLDEGASSVDEEVLVTMSSNGEILSSKLATIGEVAEMSVDISHVGAHTVELSIDYVEGELTDLNNRVVTSIEGINEALNILLVSGQPSVSARMWRDIFKADANANLVHFTIMRPPEKMDYTPLKELSLIPFPVHEVFSEKINDFDMIVMDNYKYRGVMSPMYFNNIAKYVENGGALLVASGNNYAGKTSIHKTPLSSILPATPNGAVIEKSYLPTITDLGDRHPVTRGLSGAANDTDPDWGRWFSVVDTEVASADVVMSGADDKPLLVLDRKGKGRTAMLLSDQAWLWQRGYEGGGPYEELTRRVSSWLLKNPAMDEEALRLTEKDGQLIIEQQTLADENTEVTVTTSSGEKIVVTPKEIAPGLWRASLPIEEGGVYSVEQAGPHPAKAFVNVGPENPREFSNTISTTDKLAPLVASFNGKIDRMGDGRNDVDVPNVRTFEPDENTEAMSGSNWMGIRISDETILKGVDRKNIIPFGVGMLAMVTLLGAAFLRESETSLFKKKTKTKSNDADKPPSP